MDPKLIAQFKEFGQDLYTILEIEYTESQDDLKKAFRDCSRKYHPDKNKAADANDKFDRIKKAHEILSDEKLKKEYDKYQRGKKMNQERVKEQKAETRYFAEDLKRREEEAKQEQENKKQKEISKEERKRKEREKLMKEEEEIQQKEENLRKKMSKQELREQILKEEVKNKAQSHEIDNKQYSTIKVKWSKDLGMNYSEDMLRMTFEKYGKISDVIMHEKRTAWIEYTSRLSAEKAHADNTKEAKEKLGIDDGLKVSLLCKPEKKVKTEKNSGKTDFSLSSDTLNRLSNSANLSSDFILNQAEAERKRQEQKQKLLDEMLKNEGFEY